MTSLSRFAKSECGATSLEYALIASFIGIAIISSVSLIAPELNSIFSDAANGMKNR